MNLNNARFEITAVKPDQYPVSGIPEAAFVGRSNVGKSSIINTLLNRKSLARVGATPGKTKEINFYNIDDKMYLVDLPGYGYAGVGKEKKSSWGKVIETYLNVRQQLKIIIMLVDIRHTPSADDKVMYEWITAHSAPHIVVASKADKIPKGQVNARLKDIKETLGMGEGIPIIPFSSETRQGKDDVWGWINRTLTADSSIKQNTDN